MLAKQQEEWILEPVQEPIYSVSFRPDAGLRRKFIILILLILAASMIIVVQNERLVQTGYELVEMKQYAAALEKDNQTLRIDVAKLKSPERIGDIATRELGLVIPNVENNNAENVNTENTDAGSM
jgi:cell division protein FtsL